MCTLQVSFFIEYNKEMSPGVSTLGFFIPIHRISTTYIFMADRVVCLLWGSERRRRFVSRPEGVERKDYHGVRSHMASLFKTNKIPIMKTSTINLTLKLFVVFAIVAVIIDAILVK